MASNEEHHVLDLPTFTVAPKLLIVVSPYYKAIAGELLAGAKGVIAEAGGTFDVVEVPGALEIPTAIAIADRKSNFDGYVALGCVIRGETTHYETVCNDSSHALQLMGLQGLCIGNGILTVENAAQADVRAESKGQNKGGGAAAAALHLIALSRKWGTSPTGVGFHADAIKLAGDPKDTSTA